jgi:hypothetical protein
MIGDTQKVEGYAVVTCAHEGGAKCAKPAALRFRARGARGARSAQGKQAINLHSTDGKGKGKGKGKGEPAPAARGTPYSMWKGVVRESANSGKRKLHEAEAEAAAQGSNDPGGDDPTAGKAGDSDEGKLHEAEAEAAAQGSNDPGGDDPMAGKAGGSDEGEEASD